MKKLIFILILFSAGFLLFRYASQGLHRQDVPAHLARWEVRMAGAGFKVLDVSETSSKTFGAETLEAQKGGVVLKMTRTKTEASQKYIDDKKFLFKSLFLPTTSPYPEVITNIVECPEEFKPKVKETEQGTIYTLFAGDRFTYGICAQDLAVYHSAYGIFDCKEKGIFEVRLFSKTKEGLQPLIESFTCG